MGNHRPTSKIAYLFWLGTLFASAYISGWIHGNFSEARTWLSTLAGASGSKLPDTSEQDEHGHEHGHGHDHEDEDSSNALHLSELAMKNLGLTEDFLKPIELSDFQKTASIPGIVVDRPGRTRLPVSAAMTGIVTHVHAVSGEAISPGDLILEMRLTHEDLVTAQKDFLQSLGDRDIEIKEIARLDQLVSTGAVSTKTLLDRQYSRDKIEALMRSQREALRLHGLAAKQIERIEIERRLLTEIQVFAPKPDSHNDDEIHLSRSKLEGIFVSYHEEPEPKHNSLPADKSPESDGQTNLLILQDLHVQKGQIVQAGELLCTLADFKELMVEGQAFETEAGLVSKAYADKKLLSASIEENGAIRMLHDLKMGWVDNEIGQTTRTLRFYVILPNAITNENSNASGQRYISWKYRTGQRMQLHVPVETWTEQIVVPIDAVARDGIETYVFQQNGDQFERVEVHERYRDQTSSVIANDGSIFPGDVIALKGSHQLQMALKNKSGGAIDPHAGHSH